MQKILFSGVILTAFFFVVHSQNDSNITLTTTIETNKTIEILSNSVKIVVKCGDTNSLLANINLDNTGTLTMSNNEQSDKDTVDTPILIMFNKCRPRTSGLLSIFKSFSSIAADNNSSEFDFSEASFFNNFRINIDNQTQAEQTSGNETIPMG